MVITMKDYIEKNIGSWLLESSEFSDGYKVVSATAKTSDHLDGFMSTIFMCDISLEAQESGESVNTSKRFN